jgi:NADPH:quinone reductase
VKPFGTVASISQIAGPMPLLSVEAVGPRRSMAHPSTMAYAADLILKPAAAKALFEMMMVGVVAEIGGEFPLAEAGRRDPSDDLP